MQAVRQSPTPATDPTPDRALGAVDDGGTLRDLDGRAFRKDAAHLAPSLALADAAAGARLVWDPCGCGGYCGMTWFEPDEIARMIAAGPPRIRTNRDRRGNISRWSDGEGAVVLLAEDDVRWADLMA